MTRTTQMLALAVVGCVLLQSVSAVPATSAPSTYESTLEELDGTQQFSEWPAKNIGTTFAAVTLLLSGMSMFGSFVLGALYMIPISSLVSFASFVALTGQISTPTPFTYREFASGFAWALGLVQSGWSKSLVNGMQDGSSHFSTRLLNDVGAGRGLLSTATVFLSQATGIEISASMLDLNATQLFFNILANYLLVVLLIVSIFLGLYLGTVRRSKKLAMAVYERFLEWKIHSVQRAWVDTFGLDLPKTPSEIRVGMETADENGDTVEMKRFKLIILMFVYTLGSVSAYFMTGITYATFSAYDAFPEEAVGFKILAAAFFIVVLVLPSLIALYNVYNADKNMTFNFEFSMFNGPFYDTFTFENRMFFLVYALNTLLNVMAVAGLHEDPVAQTVLIFFSEIVLLTMLLARSPYRVLHQGRFAAFFSMIRAFVALLCCFFVQDADSSNAGRESLGAFIISTIMFPLFLVLFYLLYTVGHALFGDVRAMKAHNKGDALPQSSRGSQSKKDIESRGSDDYEEKIVEPVEPVAEEVKVDS